MDDLARIVDAPYKRPRRFARTRLALSVFCGVLIVVLGAMWVRSYQLNDIIYRVDNGNLTTIGCSQGRVYLDQMNGMAQPSFSRGWRYRGVELTLTRRPQSASRANLSWNCPFWILTTVASAGVIAPWIRPRFSLRTMLIATTLVAVVLGLGVWLNR